MKPLLRGWVLALVVALTACNTTRPPDDGGLRGGSSVVDSAFMAQERAAPTPPGYGLYTVLLVRAPNPNAVRVLTEIFVTTVAAPDAALPPANLNLITIPVRDAAKAGAAMGGARAAPEPTARAVLASHYDYGQAARLLASVCRPERGARVMQTCGAALPNGPLLVSSVRPIDPDSPLQTQRLLVVNLEKVSGAAVGEVMESFRRQIRRQDFADRAETEHWRLAVLDVLLDAAKMLPGLSKAYAAPP
jgi:hypothetical protein